MVHYCDGPFVFWVVLLGWSLVNPGARHCFKQAHGPYPVTGVTSASCCRCCGMGQQCCSIFVCLSTLVRMPVIHLVVCVFLSTLGYTRCYILWCVCVSIYILGCTNCYTCHTSNSVCVSIY